MSRALYDSEVSPNPAFGVHRDAWLSGVLGKPALRVISGKADGGAERLVRSSSRGNVFATAKIAVEDVTLVGRLQDIGFRVVDTALTFECETPSTKPAGGIRFVRAEDRDRIAQIAGKAFRYSRFHLDPMISNQLANRVKSEWATNYFNGARGDAMVVAESETSVVGFLLMLRGGESQMVIDLIAVDPEYARRGFAKAMIAFSAVNGYGDGRRPGSILVGTQAANIPSVRLYESMGFRLSGAQYVLHFHGDGDRIMQSAEAINK